MSDIFVRNNYIHMSRFLINFFEVILCLKLRKHNSNSIKLFVSRRRADLFFMESLCQCHYVVTKDWINDQKHNFTFH